MQELPSAVVLLFLLSLTSILLDQKQTQHPTPTTVVTGSSQSAFCQ
jgi:hypothetical protein